MFRARLAASLALATWASASAPALAAVGKVSADPAHTPPTLRLDDRARPLRYAARLTVTPSLPTFQAAIDIDLTIARPTDLLWLDATELTVDKAAFTVGGATVAARVVPGGEDFLGFAAARPLPAGPARLHIEYHGALSRKDDRGLFAQREGDRWYAMTQFEAIFARRVFPCFDEPGIKVPWQLTLEVPRGLTAISNTPVVGESAAGAGYKTVRFAVTPPLSSYLVSFAVGPYAIVDGGQAGGKRTPVRIVTPFGRAADAAWAASISGTLLELVERYFGIPFPFDKLDHVAIPLTSTFGAMENVGMITYAQGIIIAKPTNRSLHFDREYALTAAHEIAHQWFGDLVTTAWWDDLWLNESFASWMEAKIIDGWKPEWTHHTKYVEARAEALAADALLSARQIRQPIRSNDDIYDAFDAITYQKGESVLAMFERFVGVDTFQSGIRHYLGAHANGTATADDFVGAISAAAGRDVAPAFKSFLDQAGAPLVDVALACAAGKPPTLKVTQRRFLPVGSKGSPDQTWQIPMCLRWTLDGDGDGKAQRSCTLVTAREQSIALGEKAGCPTWLLANEAEVGYYRAAYEPRLWRALLGPEGRQRLDLPETVGVLDDLQALVQAGRVPLGDALALTPSLAADGRRLVAEEVIELVASLHAHLVPADARPSYRRYIGKLFGARARALGWLPKAGEDEDTRLLRPSLLALVTDEGEEPALAREARALALAWIADRKTLSPDVAATVLRSAARAGDRALFDAYHAEARRASDRHDRELLLHAMGSFRDPAVARAALALVGSNEFDVRETLSILYGLSQEAATRQLGWDYLKGHFDQLTKRLSAEVLAAAPRYAVSFCDEPHQRDMEQFFRDRSPKLPGGPRQLAQAVEESEICRAYVGAQRGGVIAFLQQW